MKSENFVSIMGGSNLGEGKCYSKWLKGNLLHTCSCKIFRNSYS
jgi:hypothetical protein